MLASGDEFDVFADQATKHAVEAERQLAQIDDARFVHLLTREREQPMRQVRCAARPPYESAGAAPAADAPRRGPRRVDRSSSSTTVQHVVQIVRDAAGEAADAFELLHLRELLFQLARARLTSACNCAYAAASSLVRSRTRSSSTSFD